MGGKWLTPQELAEMHRLRELGYTHKLISKMVGRSMASVSKEVKGVHPTVPTIRKTPVVAPEPESETPEERHRYTFAIPTTLLHVRDLVNYCEAMQAENAQWLVEVETLETTIREMKASIEDTNRKWLGLVEASNAGIISNDAVRKRGMELIRVAESN